MDRRTSGGPRRLSASVSPSELAARRALAGAATLLVLLGDLGDLLVRIVVGSISGRRPPLDALRLLVWVRGLLDTLALAVRGNGRVPFRAVGRALGLVSRPVLDSVASPPL
jgi:hypothetical protein